MGIRVIIFFTSLLMSFKASAQSDIQVMLKQIALLAVHVRELEKAIEIARDGLTTIKEIKNGEFNLHNLFFSSLQSVNPQVAKYSKIAVIMDDQVSIISDFRGLFQRLRTGNRLSGSEIAYMNSVYTHLSDECSKTLADLLAVTTSGRLEMTDDERIKRIDLIYDDMKDKYAFSRQFTSGTDRLNAEREKQESETQILKTLE